MTRVLEARDERGVMSKNSRAPSNQVSALPMAHSVDGTISYEPTLIPDLTSQHTRMLHNLKTIDSHARNGDFGKTAEALEEFRRQLHAHLLQENLFLYSYLTQTIKQVRDDNRRQLATEMFNEMSVIGRSVIEFLNYYLAHPASEHNLAVFCTELGGVCNALQDRMFREEMTLFKLYLPPTG